MRRRPGLQVYADESSIQRDFLCSSPFRDYFDALGYVAVGPAGAHNPGICPTAWAYCLGLVVAAWNASREDESTKDVQLERGVVQSMTHRSQDLAEIQILVGDVTQVFTAAEGALAYLAPRDSVMFAYMHQPREIINIATIDVSTPGRVARVGGWKRSGNAELLGRFWPRLLTRKDLYNQAFVATILPGGCGAAATGGLALGVWGWGWPGAAFLALVGIWLILNMVVYSVSNNWERMAAMELDVGHVQEVEEWESYFSDSGKIPNQSIVIAETAARDSLNQRTYQYEGEELFAVRVGDLVMLSTSAWGQILDLRNESRPTLQQPGASSRIRLQEELEDRRRQWAEELPDRLQQWAEEVVQSFPDKPRNRCPNIATGPAPV